MSKFQWLYPSMWVHALKGGGGREEGKGRGRCWLHSHSYIPLPAYPQGLHTWCGHQSGAKFSSPTTHSTCVVSTELWTHPLPTLGHSEGHMITRGGSHEYKGEVTWPQGWSHDHKWGPHDHRRVTWPQESHMTTGESHMTTGESHMTTRVTWPQERVTWPQERSHDHKRGHMTTGEGHMITRRGHMITRRGHKERSMNYRF